MFPIINNIEQVREAIKDHPEFSEREHDRYIIFDYNYNSGLDTFPEIESENDAILRECRGITFYKDGSLASRKYHKFFSVGEREETFPENIDFSRPHYIMKKMDGSLITPFVYSENDRLHVEWHSKNGHTDTAISAEKLVTTKYNNFAKYCYLWGYTPLFEYITKGTQIVVNYTEDALVLTGIRDNESGEYLPYSSLQKHGDTFGLQVVSVIDDKASLEDLMKYASSVEGEEGFVLAFEDGSRYKLKSLWYLQLHKAKSFLCSEKNVLKLILEGKDDDFIPLLDDENKKEFFEYKENVFKKIHKLYSYLNKVKSKYKTAKEFAITENEMPIPYRTIIFSLFRKDSTQAVINCLLKYCNKDIRLKEVRFLFLSGIEYKMGMFKLRDMES